MEREFIYAVIAFGAPEVGRALFGDANGSRPVNRKFEYSSSGLQEFRTTLKDRGNVCSEPVAFS